ncbi:hypothetical protein QBC40DRAFT_327095 [Triangularia verruculosa]|uniref:CFEM domain-containing protein n=1 Tax=Triangularia verruculosa TaxID=2587418 RepID=A0AAN6XKM1_9PEZI|nr:hypothetical protein QBC40DRAFT_327095 [Triangularia verruculosa]
MYLILVAIIPLFSISAADVPISVESFPPFLEQRDCVKLCLWHTSASDDLVVAIGCSKPWVNECLCQRELASKASSFVSKCVASRCGSPKEADGSGGAITRALGVYNDYCATNGMSIPTVASIKSFNGYLALPECARLCLWHAGQVEDDLMPNMGCGEPWDNGCMCDRQNNESRVSRGKDFVTGCVASRCGTRQAQDGLVTEALGVWGSYCGSAGSSLAAITEGATTVASFTTTGFTIGPSHTDTQDGGHEPEPAQISGGAIAGIAVGGVAVITAVVVASVLIMYRRRKNKTGTPPSDKTCQPAAAEQIHEKPTEQEVAEADQNDGVAPRHELADPSPPHAHTTELSA